MQLPVYNASFCQSMPANQNQLLSTNIEPIGENRCLNIQDMVMNQANLVLLVSLIEFVKSKHYSLILQRTPSTSYFYSFIDPYGLYHRHQIRMARP